MNSDNPAPQQGSTRGDSGARRGVVLHLVAVAAMLLLVAAMFCFHYKCWSRSDWRQPVAYTGDALWGLAYTKAMATGDIKPIAPKNVPSLGAPFGANWNDYPSVEEGVSLTVALSAAVLGLFEGVNFALLLAHILAALSFYFACRELRYDLVLSLAGAALFATSHYAFFRSFGHLGLTYYWHLPLGMLVAYWCFTDADLAKNRRRVLIALAVAVAFGLQNPYYSWLFLQLLGGAALLSWIATGNWRRIVFPSALAISVVLIFAAMNIDTFYYQHVHGRNIGAVVRTYGALELYSLKPIELFVPRWHSFAPFQNWARETYYDEALFLGEAGVPYLGIVGATALAAMCISVGLQRAKASGSAVPLQFWGVLWVVIYSVPGGLNGILGLGGLHLFRCTNRYSIAILALILLYAVRELSAKLLKWPAAAKYSLAGAIVAIGLYDQIPPSGLQQNRREVRKAISQDRSFVATLEDSLPANAMVFQLPAVEFPESPPAGDLTPYSHFRPYLYSHRLQFSYGDGKGRTRPSWQQDVQRLPPADMIRTLEQYGFAAILIHRLGYADRGAALREALGAERERDILNESDEYMAIRLHPARVAVSPPDFTENWDAFEITPEGNHRWAFGEAVVILRNQHPEPQTVRLRFGLGTVQPRRIVIKLKDRTLLDRMLGAGEQLPEVELQAELSPGSNSLHFWTNRPGEPPGNGDPRNLAFMLKNFSVAN